VLTLAKDTQSKNLKTTRKPKDLTKNWHSGTVKKGQHTLCQGKMKKREDDAADDDDDAVSENQCFTRRSDGNTVY
jgi:hypothetical protein